MGMARLCTGKTSDGSVAAKDERQFMKSVLSIRRSDASWRTILALQSLEQSLSTVHPKEIILWPTKDVKMVGCLFIVTATSC